MQRVYFQETLSCRKEFDLAQLKEKKQLSIMTFTRLHTCPWKELMEQLSSAFCFPLTIFLPLVSFTKRWWTTQWHLSFFFHLYSLSLSLLRDGVWKSSMIYHQLKAEDGVTLRSVCMCVRVTPSGPSVQWVSMDSFCVCLCRHTCVKPAEQNSLSSENNSQMAQSLLTELKTILHPTHICANISQTHTYC